MHGAERIIEDVVVTTPHLPKLHKQPCVRKIAVGVEGTVEDEPSAIWHSPEMILHMSQVCLTHDGVSVNNRHHDLEWIYAFRINEAPELTQGMVLVGRLAYSLTFQQNMLGHMDAIQVILVHLLKLFGRTMPRLITSLGREDCKRFATQAFLPCNGCKGTMKHLHGFFVGYNNYRVQERSGLYSAVQLQRLWELCAVSESKVMVYVDCWRGQKTQG
mmetsp:Transcript_51954/g.121650  ORF Transcript_51954/g.121650 Transcript_51954/m.121650 type:complete len:216 (+) Transcript_51954:826-1473(+)